MKTTTTFLISLLFITTAFSQSYIPLPTSGVVWRQLDRDGDVGICFDYQITILGDTIINSMVYQKLLKSGVEKIANGSACGAYFNTIDRRAGYFRNDSINQKVWYINPAFGINNDTLLYDFDLQIGDTLKNWYLTDNYHFIVDSLEYVILGGKSRKKFYLDDLCGGATDPVIIEGIGSNFGLLSSMICYMDLSYSLLCMKDSLQTIYPDSSYICDLVTSIEEHQSKVEEIQIYPNPTTGSFLIEDMERIENIQLYNNLGQLVKEVETHDGSINIKENSGIYFLKVIYNDGKVAFGKVVKQ